MKEYLVQWEIDVAANNPEEAAREALDVMWDRFSDTLMFTVIEYCSKEKIMVDLYEYNEEEEL